MNRLRLLFGLAWQSTLANRGKSAAIAATFFVNAALLTTITSIAMSISRALETSLIETFVGDFQGYSSDAREKLDILISAWTGELRDIGNVASFVEVEEAAKSVPHVIDVVPMGTANSYFRAPTTLQVRARAMREAYRSGDLDKAAIEERNIRFSVRQLLERAASGRGAFSEDPKDDAEATQLLKRVADDESLWAMRQSDPEALSEFIDNKVLKWAGDTRNIRAPVIGTDLDRFVKGFKRFRLVRGTMLEPGERGILVERGKREEQAKHPVALAFDGIRDALARNGGRLPDRVWRERASRLAELYEQIILQLSATDGAELEAALAKHDPRLTGSLIEKLIAFLHVDASTFEARDKFFFDVIAPKIRLYAMDVGDTMTLTGVGKDGSPKAVKVKVAGVYEFEGVRLASHVAYNLVDFATYRDLVGEPTPELDAEREALRKEAGGTGNDLPSEDDMFGAGFIVDEEATESTHFVGHVEETLAAAKAARKAPKGLSSAEIARGLIPSFAVLVDGEDNRASAKAGIEAAFADKKLGIRLESWRQVASRFAVQLGFLQMQMYLGVVAVFVVALIIANMGVVIAMANRERELGTLRALGAAPRFVLRLVFVETLYLSTAAGALGAAAGAGIVALLGRYGIAATSPAMEVIFGGPRVYPRVSVDAVVLAIAATALGALLAALLPALRASRIEPSSALRAVR